MAPLSGEWLEALKGEFHQPYYAKLYKTVMQEYQTHKIFPPADDMFNALKHPAWPIFPDNRYPGYSIPDHHGVPDRY